MLNEAPVKRSRAVKASHLHDRPGLGPSLDSFNFGWINLNSLGRNHISNEGELWSEKLTLLHLGIELLFQWNLENLS